jgi:phosphatidylinositol-3-phosphatase
MWVRRALVLLAAAAALAGCSPGPSAPSPVSATTGAAVTTAPHPSPTQPSPTAYPRPDHVLVVVLENKADAQIEGNANAPYLNGLLTDSAVMTGSTAVAHPSQPNYLALFSGSTQGVTDDHCPLNLGARANLGRQLLDAGLSFTGYSEDLPSVGFTGCSSNNSYAAKHSPWASFSNLPATTNQPSSALPADLAALPTVSFLIPNLCHDMHDCSVGTGDTWMRDHVNPYVQWARQHNSLLIVTFDEDDNSHDNRILTFVTGAGIKPGRYGQALNHYGVLASIEDWYGLPRLGQAATAAPLTGIR